MMLMGMRIPLSWPTPTLSLAPSTGGKNRRRKESEKLLALNIDDSGAGDDVANRCIGDTAIAVMVNLRMVT